MNFNQFKNLARIKDLNVHEQNRQWFLYQDNLMNESRSNALAVASAAAGGGANRISFYGFSFTYETSLQLNGITRKGDQVVNPFGLDFSGITVFEKNPDDGYNYFISYDENESIMIFGKLKDGAVTIIDTTNLTALTNNTPASLYYEGNGSFIYLDGYVPFTYNETNIIRIDTQGNCEMLLQDVNVDYGVPTCIFPYQGLVFGGVSYNYFIAGLGQFDLETGQFINTVPVEITNLPGVENYKVQFVLGSQVVNEEVYLNLFVVNKDSAEPFQCIAKLVVSEEEIYTTFVSMIKPLSSGQPNVILDITIL